MSPIFSTRGAVAVLICSAAPLAAQTRDLQGAAPLAVSVEVRSAVLVGDTTTITYVVHNRATSGEDLWALLVDTPTPALRVEAPPRPLPRGDGWVTAAAYRGEPTADWTLHAAALIRPTQSTVPLRFAAVGLPDTVRYWAVPDLLARPPLDEEDPPGVDLDPLKSYSDSGITVGVTSLAPGTTAADLLSRIRRLLDYSCGPVLWINQASVCFSLRVKLDAAVSSLAAGELDAVRGQVGAFINEVNARHNEDLTKPVGAGAYALLRPNAEYLYSRL
jgi:hypothetical protein